MTSASSDPAPAGVDPPILHASCVALGARRAVLILGPSGSGKSALALQLIALGARLVADDRTLLRPDGASLIASAPATITGRIEARGLGLIELPHLPEAAVTLVVDLSEPETDRLPPRRMTRVLGHDLPLVHKVDGPHFPSAILLYLQHGRSD